jgi:cyclopropane-fatty-acyl-phospholipid synthase
MSSESLGEGVLPSAPPHAVTARWLACRLLTRARGGELTVIEGERERRFGAGGLRASVQIHSPRAWTLLARGSRGLAESYAQGLWDTPDLAAVIGLAARNMHRIDDLRRRAAFALRPAQMVAAARRHGGRSANKKDIAAHYDLGDELFELMLDPTMSYSCAVFERPEMSLEEASVAKLERICRKLDLQDSHHVVEIGSGWGGFALHAARTRGCHVTTTTISANQYAHTRQRVREEGLQDLVTVLEADYRDLRGRYDRLVCIEMIEAVGWRNFDLFFERCSRLLEPDGAMLLQAITIADRAYELEKRAKSFINTCIFPGGCLPSQHAIRRSLAGATDMRILDVEDITRHYVETLQRWRERFTQNATRLATLGYDERFRRLWTLYLAYCEAGFAERRIFDLQILTGKPRYEA